MNELAQLFETNRIIVFSAYGQVFFVLGLAVLLRSRRYSRLTLARSLWLLGAFGILHGISEWAYVFIPIQAGYLPDTAIKLLWLAHVLIEAGSFGVLFQFGAELIRGESGREWIRYLPGLVFVVWGLLFLYLAVVMPDDIVGVGNGRLFVTADILGRYWMALPGSILAGVGLLRQAQTVEKMHLAASARHMRGAAIAFLAYAPLAGLFVAPAHFFPANVLNSVPILETLGVPVPVFRSICGLVIVYCISRALKVFEVEMDRMIEAMERVRVLSAERERIGRELHDGTIQSIYAAGLALDDVGYAIGKDNEVARQKLQHVLASLDTTIGGIRRYVLDLRSLNDGKGLEERLRGVVEEFACSSGVMARLQVSKERRTELAPALVGHLTQVAREALANVARHAAASQVEVNVKYAPDAISMEIRDNGKGFDRAMPNAAQSSGGLGLNNMARRVELVGGKLGIKTAPGQGTRIAVEVPVE